MTIFGTSPTPTRRVPLINGPLDGLVVEVPTGASRYVAAGLEGSLNRCVYVPDGRGRFLYSCPEPKSILEEMSDCPRSFQQSSTFPSSGCNRRETLAIRCESDETR